MTKRATREYPQPPPTVFSALLEGLPRTRLRIVGSDPASGVIRARTGMTWLSWSENVTIHLQVLPDEHTAVTVESRFRFQLAALGGVHENNFRLVFDMLDWSLGPSRSQPPGGGDGRDCST
jgi:hypothetical protein